MVSGFVGVRTSTSLYDKPQTPTLSSSKPLTTLKGLLGKKAYLSAKYSEFCNLICNLICCFYDGWRETLSVFLPFNHLDDSSFNLVVHEFSHGPLSYDADRLKILLLNSVEGPELFNSLSSHLNPDSNFITRLPDSGYMVEEDLNYLVTSFGKMLFYYTYKHSKLNEKFR